MAKSICINHPNYLPSSRLGKLYEPIEDCFVCWTAYIEDKYSDQDCVVEGRDMVKLMQLFNRELALLDSGSVSRDRGFDDPEYER